MRTLFLLRRDIAALALSPTNDTVLWSSYDPTDSSNASAVFETARRRVWPVFVIEQTQDGYNLIGGAGNMACPQAINLTGIGSPSASSATTSSSAVGGIVTSTGAAATSTAVRSSSKEQVRRIQAVQLGGIAIGSLLFIGPFNLLL
jgi:hypothetical protein